MLKIDLAKGFDRVEWSFLHEALRRKGYAGHFIKLIHSCISTAAFSVNVNGQVFGRFRATRGIRQGCPLSTYLFVLAINELSIRLQHSLDGGELTGVTLGPGCPPMRSILFADDLIICGQANIRQVKCPIGQSLPFFLVKRCHKPLDPRLKVFFQCKILWPILCT